MADPESGPFTDVCHDPVCFELEQARTEGKVVMRAGPDGVSCKWICNGVEGRGKGASIREAWDRCTEDYWLRARLRA